MPPFGFSLEVRDGRLSTVEGFFFATLAAWPERKNHPDAPEPLSSRRWGGVYKNSSGKNWVKRINEWHRDGKAAGLSQDTFRSFDDGHSSIPLGLYPQMNSEQPIAAFGSLYENVFKPRVTMGVQSYGSEGRIVIEDQSRRFLRAYYESGMPEGGFQRYYRMFYENNFLFVAPAVGSYKPDNDAFTFLSPFYLHSIGASGSDSRLLQPLVMASAALPPDLKTRILRSGLFVPTMMYLFKSAIAGNIPAPEAHVPAYALPPETADDTDGPTPFLDTLLNAANGLTHIPPVCRMKFRRIAVVNDEDAAPDRDACYEENTYAFTGALRQGQAFLLDVDLRYSWTDKNLPIVKYHAAVLRGKGEITPLNEHGSVLRIRIPWSLTDNRRNLRSDVALLVHDGACYSAPAYISVRHIHRLDPITLGIRVR